MGQAPGWQDNQRGVPFIGQAGQYLRAVLDAVLERYGIDWEDFYFTNLVKCFPGRVKGKGDKEPPAYAIEACKAHLTSELDIIQPKLIVAVGAQSMRAFGIAGGVQQNSGRVFDTEYGKVLCILHPAGLMRKNGLPNVPAFHTSVNAIATALAEPLIPPPHTADWTEYIF